MVRVLFTCLVCVLMPAQVYAGVNAQDAQKLKNIMQGMLDYQKNVSESLDMMKVVYDGEIKVEPTEDYYAVTLPAVTLEMIDEVDDFSLDIGVITLNAMPDEKPGYWKAVIQLPSSFTLKDGEGEALSVAVGSQNTIAMLNEQLGYFTKFNVNLTDIAVQGIDDVAQFKLGGLQFYQNMEQQEDASFSGPYSFSLSNLNMSSLEDAEGLQFEELKVEGNLDQMKLPTLQEYEKKVIDFAAALKSLEAAEESGEDADPNAALEPFMAMYDFDWNGASAFYSVKNMTVHSSAQDENFQLANAVIGMDFSGLKSDKGNLNIKMSYDGLSVDEIVQDAALTPKKMNLDFNLVDFPYVSLSEMLMTTLPSIIENPDTAEMVGMGLMMRVPSLLTQSGTKLEIKDNGLEHDDYNVSFDGLAQADLKSMLGFKARFDAVFDGLDTVLSSLEQGTPSMMFGGFVDQLRHFKTLGVKKAGAKGDAYSYAFEVTPEGKMLVNGQDAMSVMP